MKKTKLLIVVLSLIGFVAFGQNNGITKYCEQYLQDETFKSVYVNPKLFKMITTVSPDQLDPDVQQLISNLEGLQIVSTESGDSNAYYKESSLKLRRGYEELMEIKKGSNDHVLYLIEENGNQIKELIMILHQPGYFSIVSFVGDIDLKVLAKLGESLDIEGMNYLKELENK